MVSGRSHGFLRWQNRGGETDNDENRTKVPLTRVAFLVFCKTKRERFVTDTRACAAQKYYPRVRRFYSFRGHTAHSPHQWDAIRTTLRTRRMKTNRRTCIIHNNVSVHCCYVFTANATTSQRQTTAKTNILCGRDKPPPQLSVTSYRGRDKIHAVPIDITYYVYGSTTRPRFSVIHLPTTRSKHSCYFPVKLLCSGYGTAGSRYTVVYLVLVDARRRNYSHNSCLMKPCEKRGKNCEDWINFKVTWVVFQRSITVPV